MASRSLLIALCLVSLSGCVEYFPNVFHPGPGALQRDRAEYHDPYPDPDLGPNDLGARPHDYTRPSPENERVQNERTFSERYRQSPPPGLFRPIGPPPPATGPTTLPAAPLFTPQSL